MSPSVEDIPTLGPNGTSEPHSQDQVPSNQHATATSSSSPPSAVTRSKRVPPRRGSVDKDAQELVISSLRAQVQDLVSQVTELNNKLVKSYDRVSDLEDNIHVTSSALRSSSVKISQLELERSQHLSALNTGLLVEKSHVTAELTRLMEKATEEAAKRGQAESARADIEKDLDDVSAALFDQANTMVAEARLGRAQSDRKAEEAERALVEAEDAVKLMQQELQTLQQEKESAERSMENMGAAMGKGKWVERASSLQTNVHHHLFTSHVAYHEFLSLVSHLRTLRATSSQPPVMGSLLGLPFIARLQTEDTDPTVRLDMAAALNWLSRRSIMAAIQNGQLTIEPIATQTILASATSPQPPLAVAVVHGSTNTNLLSCGLCGQGIVPHTEPSPTRAGYLSRSNGTQFNTWSSSIFRKSPVTSTSSAPPSPPPYHDTSSLPAQIYIFRISDSPAFPSALPLCASGWCLTRLRTTCTLWSFLRTNILEKVWEEAQPPLVPPPRREIEGATVDKPPVPPRRKTKGSGFWGVASSFGLDRVPGWDKDKRPEPEHEKRRFVAPPLRSNSPGPSSLGPPPPLPKRNRSRQRTPVPADNEAEGRRSSLTDSSARGSQSSASDRRVSVKPEGSPTLSGLLVSSPDDVDPSNECFNTPFEDPATPEMASVSAQTPASVPQPGSSHNTPAATSIPLPEETNKTHNEPEAPNPQSPSSNSEYFDPRPQTPPAANTARPEPVSPPSRTGSPGAPPLPRRAAARRRVPPPPVNPPAPAVDASSTEVAKQPNGHHHPEETEARAEPDAKVDAPIPVIDAPDTEAPPPSSEERGDSSMDKTEEEGGQADVLPATEPTGSAVQEQETSGAEAEFVDAVGEMEPNGDQSDEQQKPEPQPEPRLSVDSSTSHSNDAVIENSAEGAETTATPNDAEAEAEKPNGLEKEEKTNMAEAEAAVEAEEKEKEKPAVTLLNGKARQPPLPPPRHPHHPPPARSPERRVLSELTTSPVSKSDTGKSQTAAEPVYAPDGTPYVGDATWEERTWKELTRLREDMFWARLGSAQ